MMLEVQQGPYRGLHFPGLPASLGFRHVFGGRAEDDLGNLALSGERDREAALAARDAWSERLQVNPADWVVGGQMHTAKVAVVGEDERGRGARAPETTLPETDGLLTTTPGLPLYVAVADCSAVLLHAPGMLAVVHGGWRGLAAGILDVALGEMAKLGADFMDIHAGIAPCIAAESYEVGPEVGDQAPDIARFRGRDDRWQVDIGCWARACLLEVGVPRQQTYLAGIDTGTDLRCFSHRRQGVGAGRNGLLAVLV